MALPGMDEAITQLSPAARVSASADDCLGLHPDRATLDHGQELLTAWLARSGLTLHVSKTPMSHTLAGDQLGGDFLGCTIRQSRVGKHQSGKGPGGDQRLGYTTLMTPAKATMQEQLAELGRVMRAGQHWPQAALLHKLNPTRRGWANDYRPWVSQATCGRVDRLPWVKRRSWARRRHPNTAARWGADRYGHRRASRQVCAPPATRPSQAYLASPTDTSRLRHAQVTGHRSPDEGDWVSWSQRRGQSPTGSPRRATLSQHQGGRCPYCGRVFHHADQREIDHLSGNRRDSRSGNLHAVHGHGHDAQSRAQGADLPVGRRDNVSGH